MTMAKVLSFQNAAAKKEEESKVEAMKQHILELMKEMTQEEMVGLLDAIENNNQEKYFAITEPVIKRKIIREFNA
jgi:uncharacterized protein YjgD (DUF1641 family)